MRSQLVAPAGEASTTPAISTTQIWFVAVPVVADGAPPAAARVARQQPIARDHNHRLLLKNKFNRATRLVRLLYNRTLPSVQGNRISFNLPNQFASLIVKPTSEHDRVDSNARNAAAAAEELAGPVQLAGVFRHLLETHLQLRAQERLDRGGGAGRGAGDDGGGGQAHALVPLRPGAWLFQVLAAASLPPARSRPVLKARADRPKQRIGGRTGQRSS